MKKLELTEEEVKIISNVIKLILSMEELSQKQGLPRILYDEEIGALNVLETKLNEVLVEDQYNKLWTGKEKVEA